MREVPHVEKARLPEHGLLGGGGFDDAGFLPLCQQSRYFTEMCSGSEAGSCVRFIDLCVTQL